MSAGKLLQKGQDQVSGSTLINASVKAVKNKFLPQFPSGKKDAGNAAGQSFLNHPCAHIAEKRITAFSQISPYGTTMTIISEALSIPSNSGIRKKQHIFLLNISMKYQSNSTRAFQLFLPPAAGKGSGFMVLIT